MVILGKELPPTFILLELKKFLDSYFSIASGNSYPKIENNWMEIFQSRNWKFQPIHASITNFLLELHHQLICMHFGYLSIMNVWNLVLNNTVILLYVFLVKKHFTEDNKLPLTISCPYHINRFLLDHAGNMQVIAAQNDARQKCV